MATITPILSSSPSTRYPYPPPSLSFRFSQSLHSLSLHLSIQLLSFIYLCFSALSARFLSFTRPTMVTTTRPKNKLAHPAAPVMTSAAKQKAGIKTRARPKRKTKDETIRELEARIAALEDPDEEMPSKEPLVRTSLKFTCPLDANIFLVPQGKQPTTRHGRLYAYRT